MWSIIQRFLPVAFILGLWAPAPARAGLTLQLQTSRWGAEGYYFYVWLASNNVAPAYPLGSYLVTSWQYPTNGCSSWSEADENGIQGRSGGAWFYTDYGAMMAGLTNGNWSVYVTNGGNVATYHFSVDASGLSPETFGSRGVRVLYPNLDEGNGMNVPRQPECVWEGPENWSGSLSASLDRIDSNGDSIYVDSIGLSPEETSWTPSVPLTPGSTNTLYVTYSSNITGLITTTTPVDAGANPLSGWSDATTVYVTHQANFVVQSAAGGGDSGHSLIAFWGFDEGNWWTSDLSGNGYDIGGAGWISAMPESSADARFGAGAIEFFGGGWLSPPTNLVSILARSFSVSLWLKTSDLVGNATDSASDGAGVFAGNTDQVIPVAITGGRVAFGTGGWDQPEETLHSSLEVNTGEYTHVVVTRDQRTGEKKIYVNGALDASGSGVAGVLASDYSSPELWLGMNRNFNGGFVGWLDQVQIYSGVLGADEVAYLFGNPGGSAPDTGSGLWARYDFDEGVALAADVSGNGNDLAAKGDFGGSGPEVTAVAAAGAGAVYFDGASYLSAPANLLHPLARSFSLSLWVKTSQSMGSLDDPASAGAAVVSADCARADARDLVPVALTGGQVAFATSDGYSTDTLNSYGTVNDNAWHHLTVTRDRDSGEKRIYIDGYLDSSQWSTLDPLDGPRLITLGARADADNPDVASPGLSGENGYEGYLDEVQVYQRVLSEEEVLWLAQHPGETLGGTGAEFNDALNTVGWTWLTGGDRPWGVQSTNTHDGVLAAVAGPLSSGQESWLQTTVSGPGTLSFWWSFEGWSGEGEPIDYSGWALEYRMDDSGYGYTYASFPWEPRGGVFIPPGHHTITWRAREMGIAGIASSEAGAGPQMSGDGTYFAYLDEVRFTTEHQPIIETDIYGPSPVEVGLSPTYSLSVNANPNAVYYWYKNYQFFRQTEGPSLTLTNIQLADAGSYYVVASNYLGEAYSSSFYLQVYEPTDLRPLALSFPAVISSAFATPFTWTVTNTGPGSARQFYDRVSFDPPIATPVFYDYSSIGTFYFGNTVAAGSTYTATNLLRMPMVLAGTYPVSLLVDAYGQIIETNETNNTLGASITIINPDLQPGALTLRGATNLYGAAITFSYFLTNNGPGAIGGSTLYDRAYVSTFPGLDETSTPVRQINLQPNLAAGEYLGVTNSATLPLLPSGDYYLVIKSDDFGYEGWGNFTEGNESNNIVAVPFRFESPDLAPAELLAPAIIAAREPLTLSWVVANLGDGMATNPASAGTQWYDRLYLSPAPVINSSSIRLGSYDADYYRNHLYYSGRDFAWPQAVPGGAVATNSAVIDVPNVPPGDYYLVLQVDFNNNVRERNETNNLLWKAVTVAPVELAVQEFVAPSSANSRATFPVSWRVANQGSGTLYPEWLDEVYLSTNSTLTASAISLGRFWQTNSLAAGTNYVMTSQLTLPEVNAGNYYVLFMTDAWRTNVLEANENDNFAAVPIAIASADLAAQSLLAPAILSSQQPVSPIFSVANAGAVTAFPGWSDRLYLSTNGLSGPGNIAFRTGLDPDIFWTLPVPPSTSYTQLVNTVVPAVSAGDYYLLLEANANQYLGESSSANNYLAQPVTILNPDLAITNLMAPDLVTITQLNQHLEVGWSALNRGAGGAFAVWSDSVYLSRTNVLDDAAVYLGSVGHGSQLGSGQSYNGFSTVALPNGVIGDLYLLVELNSTRALYESERTNNVLARPIQLRVPPVPTLALIEVGAPTDAWSGQPLEVTWVLTNSGPALVRGPFYDEVSLAQDATGVNRQSYGMFLFDGEIAPYSSVVRRQTINLPISLSGAYWVRVQADFYQNVFQYTNRGPATLVAAQPTVVHLTPTPDLNTLAVQGPLDTFSSARVLVSWIVTNTGAGPTRAPYWSDGVYLSASTNFNDPTYFRHLGWAGNSAYLAPGESYANSLNVDLPRGLEGTFYFLVRADDNNNVFQTNRNTLAASAPVHIALTQPPDLRVVSVLPPMNGFSGQRVPLLQFAVTNLGLGGTMLGETSWYDAVFLSTNNFLDSSARLLATIPHGGGLAPGAGYTVAATNITLPIGIQGNYYFLVSADYYNQVYEGAFELNNTKAAPETTAIQLTPPPDLVAEIQQAPTNALASHTLAVRYTVANDGFTATPNATWADALYLSTNSVFDPAKALLVATSPHYGALAPGDSYTNTLGAILPDTISGEYHLFLMSDRYAQVFELDKTNNLAVSAATVLIESRPADLVVSAIEATGSAGAGEAITVSWAVRNQGIGDTAVSEWSDRIILSANPVLGAPSDRILGTFTHSGLLEAGGSYSNRNQLLQVPSGTAPGQYYLFAATDVGGRVYEGANKGNNFSAPVPVLISPNSADLQVAWAAAPDTASACASAVVQWSVRNAGNRPANQTYWLDAVYLTRDGLVGPQSPLAGYVARYVGLEPGESYTNTLNFSVPPSVADGFQVVVIADAFNYVAEPGLKDNNVFALPHPTSVTPCPQPDFAVASVAVPGPAYAGQPLEISWTVANVGGAAGSGSWYDAVYLSLDQSLDPSDIYLGVAYSPTNSLAAGASYPQSARLAIPQGLAGPYYVIVSANHNRAVNEEGRRANNVRATAQAVQVQLLPPVDLVAGVLTIPVNGIPGQLAAITYSVLNQGSNTAIGAWSDALYLSPDPQFSVEDPLFATVGHSGDIVPGGGYTNTITAPLPGLVPGNYYVIVRSDILNHLKESNPTNNLAASLDRVLLSVPELVMGTPSAGQIEQGQSAYYQFEANQGDTVRLRYSTPASLAGNELYVRRGDMPTSGRFTYAANQPFVASPELYLPITNTGTYYVLVHNRYSSGQTDYSLLAEVLPFTVATVAPNLAGDVGRTTFRVQGALFDAETRFQLAGTNGTKTALGFSLANSSLAYVTFNLAGAASGAYDFRAVMNAGATNELSVSLSNAVTVYPGEGPHPDVYVEGLAEISAFIPNTITVFYGNSGDADATPPLVVVSGGGGTRLGMDRYHISDPQLHLLGRSGIGPADILRPQTSESLSLWFWYGMEVNAWLHTADDPRPLSDEDWAAAEAAARPADLADADWQTIWAGVRLASGPTWGGYVQFLNQLALGLPPELRNVRDIIAAAYGGRPDLRVGNSISGAVLGARDQEPLAGVEVALYPAGSDGVRAKVAGRAVTDAQGEFLFPFVPAGRYYYAITNTFFDMDRDGQVDTNAPILAVEGLDLTKQTLYAFQFSESVALTNDADAQLVADTRGVLHAFWLRNRSLWSARLDNGAWVDARRLSTNPVVNSFTAASHPRLLDGSSPGVIAVWSEVRDAGVQLVCSVGRFAGNGCEFSQPRALTSDPAQSFAPAIAIRDDGLAVVTYLKLDFSGRDDTDVYYSLVDLATGDLLWAPPAQPAGRAVPLGGSGGISADGFTIAYGNDWKFPLGEDKIGFAYSFSATGQKAGCGASLEGAAGVTATYTGTKVDVTGGGALKMKYNWQINPDRCAMEFQKASASAEATLHVDLKNAASRVLSMVPQTRPLAEAIDRFTLYVRRWVVLENTIGLGAGLSLEDVTWDRDPGPLTSWRAPDQPGQTYLTVDANVKLSARSRGVNEEHIYTVVDGDTYHSLINTNDANPDDAGAFIGTEGEAKAQVKWKVYPTFTWAETTVSGSLKVLLSPWFSYTYKLGEKKWTAPSARPLGDDDLPEGWTFAYDPDAFLGTTNRLGTNSVLADVAADLYQDGAPALAVDATGIPYQVWYKDLAPAPGQAGSHVVSADFTGGSWSAPQAIPGSLGINSFINTAVDSSGRRLAVWIHADTSLVTSNTTPQQYEAVRLQSEVVYSTFEGGAWSAPQSLAATPGPDSALRLSRLDDGRLLAVWTYLTNDATVLLASIWEGSDWSKPETVASGNVLEAAARESDGVLRALVTMEVTTNHDTALFVTTRSGSGWSPLVRFDPALAPAPAALPLPLFAQPRIEDTDLSNLYEIRKPQEDACCRCKGKLKVVQGTDLGCGRTSDTYDYTNCLRIINYRPCGRPSRDPNDILGPEGFGPERWVSGQSPLNYTVLFENDPVLAEAPAKQVTITLPLDPGFDARTFRLGVFGFSGLTFQPPPNSAFYQTRLDLVSSNGFYLDVFAGLDLQKRQAFWIFTTIDPETGGIPVNPYVGFLPVNTNSPAGEGSVTFTVRPAAGLEAGAQVQAMASIVFDNQPPLDTPTWSNRLDFAAPSSQVLALPAAVVEPTFLVSWFGLPGANSPGIASYDVYVSQDGNPYYPWLAGTTLQQAPFTGVPGSVYYFYSVARGNSGGTEAPPATPDASIFISTNLPPALLPIAPVTVAPDTLARFRAQAADTNGDAVLFSLAPGAPPASGINPTNGVFRWIPTRAHAETTNLIGIIATDNGLPPLSDTQFVSVIVLDYFETVMGAANLEGGQAATLPIRVSSNRGFTNLTFAVAVEPSMFTNWTLEAVAPQLDAATLEDQRTNLVIHLGARAGQSVTAAGEVARLHFSAVSGTGSAFVPVPVADVMAAKPDGTPYQNYVNQAGEIALVQAQPLLRGQVISQARQLLLYGRVGASYTLQSADGLGAPWQDVLSFTQTNNVMTLDLGTTNSPVFYRLKQE